MRSDFNPLVVRDAKPSTSCKKPQESHRSNVPFKGDTTTCSDFQPPALGEAVTVQSKKRSKKNSETMQWSGSPKQAGTLQHPRRGATTGPLLRLPLCLTVPAAVDLTHARQTCKSPVQSVSQLAYAQSWPRQPKPRTSYRVRAHHSPHHKPFEGDSSTHTHFKAVSPQQQSALLHKVDYRAAELSHLQQLGAGMKMANNFGSGALCCDTTSQQHFQPWRVQPHVR